MNQSNPVDFSQRQRQAPAGILIAFFLIIKKLIKNFWVLAVYLIFRMRHVDFLYLMLPILAILIIVGVVAWIRYRNLSFYVDEGKSEFILQQGIFNKEKVIIQLNKIIQVNINQSLLQRLAGVHSVEIETAGSTNSEAAIQAVTFEVAQALKQQLSSPAATLQAIPAPSVSKAVPTYVQDESNRQFKISFDNLAKFGLTTDHLKSMLILLGVFVGFFNQIKDLFESLGTDQSLLNELLDSALAVSSLFVILVCLLVISVVYNLLKTLITYYDLTVKFQDKALWLSYGLFSRNNTLLQIKRSQFLNITANYIQRKWDIYKVVIHQASTQIETDKKAKVSVPGCAQHDFQQLFSHIFGEDLPEGGAKLRPSLRILLLPGIFFLVLPVFALLILVTAQPDLLSYLNLLILYIPLVSTLLYFYYQNYRLTVYPDFIARTGGIWDVSTSYTHVHKIQSISTSQYFWHKKLNIGHVIVHTAGGDLYFRFGDFDRLQTYVNYWLYRVESVNG